jgi:glycosyltransferase involved in cell wall biosynthesis
VSRAEEIFYLKSATLYLSSATYSEAPALIHEAFYENTCVVLTDIPAQREFIEHEQTGFLIPPANALTASKLVQKLFSDRKLLETVTTQAKKMVHEKYSWEAYTTNLMSCLSQKP